VTNDLLGRVAAHRLGKGSQFTARYKLKQLVWFEGFAEPPWAIQREKTLKHYSREWKINLIERDNHDWEDLFPEMMKQHGLSETDLRIIPADFSGRQ
jgi:putative endonuclease